MLVSRKGQGKSSSGSGDKYNCTFYLFFFLFCFFISERHSKSIDDCARYPRDIRVLRVDIVDTVSGQDNTVAGFPLLL